MRQNRAWSTAKDIVASTFLALGQWTLNVVHKDALSFESCLTRGMLPSSLFTLFLQYHLLPSSLWQSSLSVSAAPFPWLVYNLNKDCGVICGCSLMLSALTIPRNSQPFFEPEPYTYRRLPLEENHQNRIHQTDSRSSCLGHSGSNWASFRSVALRWLEKQCCSRAKLLCCAWQGSSLSWRRFYRRPACRFSSVEARSE